MQELQHHLEAGHGIVALRAVPSEDRVRLRRELLNAGFRLVRRGWYAQANASPAAIAAVSAGGALTCAQALPEGVWQPHDRSGLHVRFTRAGKRSPHILDHRLPGPPIAVLQAVDPPEHAVRCAIACLATADAIAVCDSVLRQSVLEPHQLKTILLNANRRGARLQAAIDPSAESGIESHLRVLLRSMHLPFRTQVMIRDVGRTDTLVGDRLVVEADGLEYHSGEQAMNDRRRDMVLHQLGFTVLRFSYWQIVAQADEVKATIRAAVAAREHRWSHRNCHWRRLGLGDPVLGSYRTAIAERWFAIQ